MYPPSIQNLIDAFSRLPGIGPKTAERFVFYLLKKGRGDVAKLTRALEQLLEKAKSCSVCFDFTEQDMCSFCSDPSRDTSVICVVADPQDAQAIERSGAFRGRYHVLRGVLDPARDISPEQLKIKELFKRVDSPPCKGGTSKGIKIKEIILALNPDMQGETTSLYLAKKLKEKNILVTRLARGLPLGSDLDYADEITLTDALKGRQKL